MVTMKEMLLTRIEVPTIPASVADAIEYHAANREGIGEVHAALASWAWGQEKRRN